MLAPLLWTLLSLPGPQSGPDDPQRYLVTLRHRSFTLAPFRAAVRTGDAARVAKVVADLQRRADQDAAPLTERVDSLGGEVTGRFWLVNACAITLPPSKLATLRKDPNIARVEPDLVAEPLIKDATNAKNHNTDAVHALGIRGAGVTVAIMDTGLDSNVGNQGRPHRTFYVNGDPKNRTGTGIQNSRLLANHRVGIQPADNPHPHGTGVAGIAAGGDWGTFDADHGHAYGANVVGYSIADLSNGGAYHSTITRAWQQIAADKVRHGIAVANNSYAGSPSPVYVSQRALDACALNTGIVCVVAAGNDGKSSIKSQSAANGLAVGATKAGGSKRVASFSSRGPLYRDPGRFYPDLCANGEGTVMPAVDQETKNLVATGTSMAAPQVAGAAALFRSVRKRATGLETKAALLLTTEEVTRQNAAEPYDSRNAYGLGYLRTDRLIAFARNPALLQTSQLARTAPRTKFTLQVTAGKAYGAVIAWHRHILTATQWSDLELFARAGTRTLASSTSTRNLYEKVVFFARASGRIEIHVQAKWLENATIPFAIAAGELDARYFQGGGTSFGTACPGSGRTHGPSLVIPPSAATSFGNSGNLAGLGLQPHRFQQITADTVIPRSFTATALTLRQDDKLWFTGYAPSTIDVTLALGATTVYPNRINSRFASNITGGLTQVVTGHKLQLPRLTGPNRDPRSWTITVPFSRSFVFQKQSGRHLLLDMTKTATTSSRQNDYFYTDGLQANGTVSFLFHTTVTSRTGWVSRGFGSVLGFVTKNASGVRPVLRLAGKPDAGGRYTLELLQARARTAALLTTGLSRRQWGAFRLPLDLGPLGAAGCTLYTSIALLVPLATDPAGRAVQVVPLPNDRFLIGAELFHQMLVVDPPSNRFGIVTSNALALTLGGHN